MGLPQNKPIAPYLSGDVGGVGNYPEERWGLKVAPRLGASFNRSFLWNSHGEYTHMTYITRCDKGVVNKNLPGSCLVISLLGSLATRFKWSGFYITTCHPIRRTIGTVYQLPSRNLRVTFKFYYFATHIPFLDWVMFYVQCCKVCFQGFRENKFFITLTLRVRVHQHTCSALVLRSLVCRVKWVNIQRKR